MDYEDYEPPKHLGRVVAIIGLVLLASVAYFFSSIASAAANSPMAGLYQMLFVVFVGLAVAIGILLLTLSGIGRNVFKEPKSQDEEPPKTL